MVRVAGFDIAEILGALQKFSFKRFALALGVIYGTFAVVETYLDAVIAAGDLSSGGTVIVALLGIMGTVIAFYFGNHQNGTQTEEATIETAEVVAEEEDVDEDEDAEKASSQTVSTSTVVLDDSQNTTET